MAHAKTVSGAVLVAGGLFGYVECVDNPLLQMPRAKAPQALKVCMEADCLALGLPNARYIPRLSHQHAANGVIDPMADTSSEKIYIFTGRKDTRVATAILDVTAGFYQRLGQIPK